MSFGALGMELAVTEQGAHCYFSRWDKCKFCKKLNFCPKTNWRLGEVTRDLHPGAEIGAEQEGFGVQSCKTHRPTPRRSDPGLSPASRGARGRSPFLLGPPEPPRQV